MKEREIDREGEQGRIQANATDALASAKKSASTIFCQLAVNR